MRFHFHQSAQTPRPYWALAVFGMLLTVIFSAHAQLPTPTPTSATPALEARLRLLETELRCLVCQNQTLAESPAGLANDLRREVRILADQGKSNEEIKTFLQARYGDFVLYRPPLNVKNALLWFGPFVLLLGGGFVVWRISRKRAVATVTEPADATSDEARKRAASLLDD